MGLENQTFFNGSIWTSNLEIKDLGCKTLCDARKSEQSHVPTQCLLCVNSIKEAYPLSIAGLDVNRPWQENVSGQMTSEEILLAPLKQRKALVWESQYR